MAGIHPHFTGLAGVFLYQQEETDSIILFLEQNVGILHLAFSTRFPLQSFLPLHFQQQKKDFRFNRG